MALWYRYDETNNLVLTLYVQPGAKNTGIAGLHGDMLKIKLAAAPVEGKANKALTNYLADLFRVSQCQIALKAGGKSRHKVIVIQQPVPDSAAVLSELMSKLR